MGELEGRLAEFAKSERFTGKGLLSIALVVTNHIRSRGLPLNADELVTSGGGQVQGAGKAPTQAILARYGEVRVLAKEAGRTSRSTVGKMRKYVELLNQLNESGLADVDAIEKFWIERVRRYFEGQPFKLKMRASQSLRSIVREVIDQARDRQKNFDGNQYTGAVLQHLVGAKLSCALPDIRIEHHSFSTSDQQTGREGDFHIGNVAVHVTTAPNENLLSRCKENLDRSVRPVIVTLSEKVDVAIELAKQSGLGGKVDVFDAEQFIALNIYELGRFTNKGHKDAVTDIVNEYNEIVDEFETDPSLRIEL